MNPGIKLDLSKMHHLWEESAAELRDGLAEDFNNIFFKDVRDIKPRIKFYSDGNMFYFRGNRHLATRYEAHGILWVLNAMTPNDYAIWKTISRIVEW